MSDEQRKTGPRRVVDPSEQRQRPEQPISDLPAPEAAEGDAQGVRGGAYEFYVTIEGTKQGR
jgi:hypothetical protein